MAHEFFDAMPVNVFEVSQVDTRICVVIDGDRNEAISSKKSW
jgi:hypothetical protein